MARNYLVLEDGTVLEGEAFGYDSSDFGEVVFSTGMDGYQEALTDPSFRGQILMLTYPLVGNYGISDEADQSDGVHVRGLVVREYCKEPSPMYGGRTLDDYMKAHRVPGISGIDTRELVIKTRSKGTFKGAIVKEGTDLEATVSKLKEMPSPLDANLVAEVSCRKPYEVGGGRDLTVGLLDCGTKKSIVEQLALRYNVKVFPYDTTAQEIADSGVDGIMVSNGPGNPSHEAIMGTVVKTVSDLASQKPIMGICFGSQIIALAFGGSTYKMKFGHRGSNQPVKLEGKVYVTSQNHGFAVDADSLDGTGLEVNQININDGTVEGVKHRDLPVFTCQYHPEANPGPLDTRFLLDRFGRMMEAER